MYCSLRNLVIIAFVSVVPTVAMPCLAQNPPRPLDIAITSAAQLTPAQQDRVSEYVAFWASQLTGSDSTSMQVQQARDQLIRPLLNLNPSLDFVFTYSGDVEPVLTPAIDGDRLHTAINSLLVLSQLGTNQALSSLLQHSDIRDENRWQIRLHASTGCRHLMQGQGVEARKVVDAVKKLRDAALREDQPLVLHHQFKAINAADHSKLEPQDRQVARQTLLEAVTGVVDRMHKNNNPEPSPLVDAVNGAVVMLRDKILQRVASPAEAQTIGQNLGPRLGMLLDIIRVNWQHGHDVSTTDRSYRVVIGTCEGFLQLIDRQVRPRAPRPNTNLRAAWTDVSQDQFDKDVKAWMEIVQKAPYVAPKN